MDKKNSTPNARQSDKGGATSGKGRDKGSEFISNLPFHQRRLYNLLSDGVPRSAADISIALRLSDPRSSIRELRAKGVPIVDEWTKAEHGGQFKRYYIAKR